MKTFDIDTHSLMGVGITVGLVSIVAVLVYKFMPEFGADALAKATAYLDLIPTPGP